MGRRGDREQEADAAQDIEPAVLELAREIQADILRVAADPDAHLDLLDALIDGISAEKRLELARSIFDQLSPEQQWAVLERVFDDEELRAAIEGHRDAVRGQADRDVARVSLADRARQDRQIDTREVEPGDELTLGLFVEHDVRAALHRGHTSSTCARRLVLRSLGEGRFQVIADTFNPNGGYFVTAEYSADTWRDHDRLDPHAVVRVGSIAAGHPEAAFEPVLYAGGRVDVEIGGDASRGRLHLGFAMLSELDVFGP